ncbi:MAG: glycosyltransferase family 9 protein [Bacteroidetes bacterium]|nr:glycosyltransferase family 9 protein [Bacteroidota bacterium]
MKLNEKFISKVKNILVVGKNNQVGDMICSLPLYAALKKRFPLANITLVAAKTNYPIPIKKINPHIDRVLILDRSTLKSSINFLRELRKIKYQIGIVPSTITISSTSHIINFLSGAKLRVGVRSIDGEKNKNSYLLNVKNDFNWGDLKKHQRDRNLDVVEQIGCYFTTEELKNIKINIDNQSYSFIEEFITKKFPDKSKLIIGLHPGAGKKPNIWDTEKFKLLIKKLNEKYQPYFLITVGSTDTDVIKNLSTYLNGNNILFSTDEKMKINELAALLKKISIYITNDTGPMHIANSAGAKILALFGPNKSYEWGPTGINSVSIQSSTDDINKITVDEVFQKSIALLNNK